MNKYYSCFLSSASSGTGIEDCWWCFSGNRSSCQPICLWCLHEVAFPWLCPVKDDCRTVTCSVSHILNLVKSNEKSQVVKDLIRGLCFFRGIVINSAVQYKLHCWKGFSSGESSCLRRAEVGPLADPPVRIDVFYYSNYIVHRVLTHRLCKATLVWLLQE
jgi:hypothetical protein